LQREVDLEAGSFMSTGEVRVEDEKKDCAGTNPLLIHTWTAIRYALLLG